MIYKNVELYNVQEIIKEEGASDCVFCRVPNDLRLQLFPLARKKSLESCGCEIRFNLVGDSAKLILKTVNEGNSKQLHIMEVYYGCFQGNTVIIGNEPTEINVKLPEEMELLKKISEEHYMQFDPSLVRIILPYGATISMLDVIGDVTPPTISQTPKKKWLAYGSSITHGSCSIHPSGTYAMRTARRLGVDLINMGFAGSAMVDQPMADYIAKRDDWDFATLEMGVNVIWDMEAWDFRPVEDFKRRVDYFIPKIAQAHLDKPIFCIDLFTGASDFKDEVMVHEYRRVIKEKVSDMNMQNLHYICGRDLLNSVTGLSADMIHPSDEGMEELSVNLYKTLKQFV